MTCFPIGRASPRAVSLLCVFHTLSGVGCFEVWRRWDWRMSSGQDRPCPPVEPVCMQQTAKVDLPLCSPSLRGAENVRRCVSGVADRSIDSWYVVRNSEQGVGGIWRHVCGAFRSGGRALNLTLSAWAGCRLGLCTASWLSRHCCVRR